MRPKKSKTPVSPRVTLSPTNMAPVRGHLEEQFPLGGTPVRGHVSERQGTNLHSKRVNVHRHPSSKKSSLPFKGSDESNFGAQLPSRPGALSFPKGSNPTWMTNPLGVLWEFFPVHLEPTRGSLFKGKKPSSRTDSSVRLHVSGQYPKLF